MFRSNLLPKGLATLLLDAQALSHAKSAWLGSSSAVDTNAYAHSLLITHTSQQLEPYHAHNMPCYMQAF